MNNNFDLEKLENMLFDKAKTYITEFFIPLDNGMHAVLKHNNTYELMDHVTIKKTFFDRMDARLSKYYFKEYHKLRTIVYELGKPTLYDNKLNLCQSFKHEIKPYESFDKEVKNKVNTMLDYIKEVLCSDSTLQYDYLLKWFANMCKCKKNDSILYLRGGQGIGKSTITQFMMNYVIGKPLSLETGAESLITKFNIELAGKVLVVFEELEHLSANEWNSMSTKLKRYSTSDTIMLESKGEKRFQATNINNIMINTNHDCIREDEGRRVYILDVSPKRKGDLDFFGKIRKDCFNDTVGEAFFCFLCEVDTKGFYAQNFPITQSKLDAYAKRLHPIELFIKDNHILAKKSIDDSVGHFYNEFKLYCEANTIRNIVSKIDFNKKMVELGFIHYKSSFQGKASNKYKIGLPELQKVADKNHWIHELDEYCEPKKNTNQCTFSDDDEYEKKYKESQIKLVSIEIELKKALDEIEKLKIQVNNNKLINFETSDMDSDSDTDNESEDNEDEFDNMANLLSS